MKGYGNLPFRSVKKPKRANRFCFLWNARLELLLNAPQPYNTKVTFHCIILHYNTLQMRYVTLHYTINFNTKVTIQKKSVSPFMAVRKSRKHIKWYIQQGSKLTLANSQNTSDFYNLRVRKISISKRLRVRIIHVSQVKGENLLVVSLVG